MTEVKNEANALIGTIITTYCDRVKLQNSSGDEIGSYSLSHFRIKKKVGIYKIFEK